MRHIALLFSAAALSAVAAAPAHAQATRTWVSGVGDDANPCSRTAPCKTFPGAISKTAAGGEINCLDSAGFGGVTITKSMALVCDGVVGGILASGTFGITINGAGAEVIVRGLAINGGPPTIPGTNGIRFLQGNSLLVQDTQIYGFNAANGNGILVNPTAGTLKVTILNSTITHNGTAANGNGISIAPTGSAAVRAVLQNVTVSNNFVGVSANGLVNVQIDASSISSNLSTGIESVGGGGVRVGRSMIVSNAGSATTGTGVLSYLDNQINNNGTDTTPATAGGYH
jgi:hypothetical protein